MKQLVGKKVKMVIMVGDTSISLEGILKEVNQWVVLESGGKEKIINKDAVIYAEEK